jgi:hypothetical protein
MHLQELSSAKNYHEKRASQNRNIRNASANLHQGNVHSAQQKQRTSRAQYLSTEGTNTRSLPRHFKLAAHKQQSLTSAQCFYDASKDNLYVTKTIALICPLPYVQACHHFLKGLYK